MAKFHGIEKIMIGPTGLNGAPGTNLQEVTGIQLDSVNITIPQQDAETVYVEEIDSAYDELEPSEPDPITVNFATYKIDNEDLERIFGGTLEDGKYTSSRSGAERTMKVYSRPRDGKQVVITFPRLRLKPSVEGSLTKSALTAMTGNGTALTPFTDAGVALKDWYKEDILLPVGNPTSIVVTPETAGLAAAETQQLTVIAHYSNGATLDVTEDATYESGTPAAATVDAAGLITAVASGTSTVTATYMTQTDDCAVTVS